MEFLFIVLAVLALIFIIAVFMIRWVFRIDEIVKLLRQISGKIDKQ